MLAQKLPFAPINLNKAEQKVSPITIFPRQVTFQDVISNNCYQIDLYVRNQSIDAQKIRIINPHSKHYKIKTEEGNIKNLAQGLAYKISIYFCCEKIESQECLQDSIYICGGSFKEQIMLRAHAPRGKLIFPQSFNLGRLIAGIDNFRNIPLKNNGKAPVFIQLQCLSSTCVLVTNEDFILNPGQSEKIELKLKNKKTSPFQQRIRISKDKQCVIQGVFVQEYVQFLSQDGEKLIMMDFGQIFIGEKVEEKFYLANNSVNKVQMICKTFSKNGQMIDLKVDQQRGTFIIKSAPEQYAKDLKTCYSSVASQRQTLKAFSSTENKVIIYKAPTRNEIKKFNSYAFGLMNQQIQQQPIIETLVISTSIGKQIAKIPVKFISVFPRLKINSKVLQFGEIKERNDAIKTLTLTNDGERDIYLTIQQPEKVIVEGQRVIKGRRSQVLNVRLHSVRVGKIAEAIKFKLFDGFQIEVKIFATCRSSSIRTKKIAQLKSHREVRNGLFQTLNSDREGENQRVTMSTTMKSNRKDYLMDLRTMKLNKLLKEQIQNEYQPNLKEPKLNLTHSFSLNNLLIANKNTTLRKLIRQQKLNSKEVIRYCKPLTIDQLLNIEIAQTEIQLGNIFIDNLVTKMITVINKNSEPIVFQFQTSNNQTLFQTSIEPRKIDGFSQIQLEINFRPNILGAVSVSLGYVINRQHTFQMLITAFITLINIEMSKKSIEINFGNDDSRFQKFQEVQIINPSTSAITYEVKFQEGKHFYVESDNSELQPNSKTKLKIFYRPIEAEQITAQRVDADKMIIKVVGGAQNVVKCIGNVSDAKISIKQNEISCLNQIIAFPFVGKLSIKNYSKNQSIYRFQIPSELSQIISFEKQYNVISGDQKREITYTILCAQPKKINSFITLYVRGGKSTKIPVECSFVFPQIETGKRILDFGYIPLLGNNYIQTLTLKNLHKNEIKLELSKKSDCEEYLIQIHQIQRNRPVEEIYQPQLKLKKRGTTIRQQPKDKKSTNLQKVIKLLPNFQTTIEVKFIPKKINQFDIPIPLKLYGTNLEIYPIEVKLQCMSIEPIVYLHPQKVQFQTKIIGQGKNSFMKFFQIRNPHDYQIKWVIDPVEQEKTTCFYMSQTNGILGPHECVRVQVIFKPQQQGFFSQKYNVILHYKKTSLICLSFQGNAVFPCLKFRTNQILMPPVPLKVQSRAIVILQNHGYEAINISKWKTSSHFQMVQLKVNFIEGKLLSLAKKYIKIQIVCSAQSAISFTTFLQLYDQLGVKYEIALSCTFQNSLMTSFNFVEGLTSKDILYNKKQNTIRIAQQIEFCSQKNIANSTNLSLNLEFIKNWLNYELNLGIKSFPECLIENQGQLFFKMINKISGCDFIKKFQSSSSQILAINLYSYYSECIRLLKLQGAFLNQIRPEYLLSFKQYKNYTSIKTVSFQSEENFKNLSIKSWMTIFYQLVKLFYMNSLTQKILSKFTTINTLTSNLYSNQELNVLKILNSYLNDQVICNFTDKVKIFQAIQKCLQKIFNLNLTASLQALKISHLSMSNNQYIISMAKFLHQKLKQYGLCSFLSLSDFSTIGAKQMVLFLTSFIVMIYHYSSQTSICFDASIGDKVTKIIDIQNPSNKKAKYNVKFQGSEQFQIQQTELVLPIKGKAELRVVYQCKLKKQQEAKLILVPVKQDNINGLVQPLAFRLTTSIVSKITLKKIQITADLYEITTVSLEAELPIDITQLSQFNVTINNTDELIPSFYCFQNLNRNLKTNRDKIYIKLVPLSLGCKFCRVCYKSPVYGEFNFQIMAKIQSPNLIKQIRLKQLKVSKQQIVSIEIPKQNQQLANALKFLHDHHCKISEVTSKKTITPNKYSISIVESSYISICEDSSQITKLELQGKDAIHVNLKCNFGKPFLEYSCTLMIKNQAMMDVRYYKLVTSVAMKPKIVPISIKSKARQSITTKIPIKNVPCDLMIENLAKEVTIQNFNPTIKQNMDLIVSFNPQWIINHEMTLISQNHQTLEQVVYEISLKAQQPSFFDKIKLVGSSVFDKKTRIPLNLNINQQFKVITTSSRLKIESESKLSPAKKNLLVTILAGNEEKATIKLIKQQTGFFHWAQIEITNQKVQIFKTITLQESPNGCKRYTLQDFQLYNDYKLHYQEHNTLKCSVVNEKGGKWLHFQFKPIKQIQFIHKICLLNKQREYQLDIHCKAVPLPPIKLPEIISHNKNIKITIVNILNSSEYKGIYRASIQPQNIFSLDCHQFQIKAKQKKQLKILFNPESLQTKYNGMLILQSDVLPTYQYNFTAISQFSKCQKTIQCEYYSDRDTLKDIYFTNQFSKTQDFVIETQFKDSPFELVEPTNKKFTLQGGASKKIIIKASCKSKKESGNGKLTVRMQNKLWEYNLVSLQIKNFASKKIIWNCTARQIIYDIIDLPQNMKVKSIESPPQISPYLTFTNIQDNNSIKLKYCPLKPLEKQQYQMFLITDSAKYVVNCIVSVALPKFDDSIFIKTKQINEIGCVSFKLTNTKKTSVPFKAYLLKGQSDFSVEVEKNILEAYGRIGTSIIIKFASHVFNKKVQDELWVQTAEMLWRFRVKGILSKVILHK